MSDEEVSARALELGRWIREGRNYPNNYRNIQMISHLAWELMGDLTNDRNQLKQQVEELRAKLRNRHNVRKPGKYIR